MGQTVMNRELKRSGTYLVFPLALAALMPAGALAQAKEGEPGVVYQKTTTVSFDGDTIDGDLTRPDGAYVESRKRLRHSNLIRVREHWRRQILQSVQKL